LDGYAIKQLVVGVVACDRWKSYMLYVECN